MNAHSLVVYVIAVVVAMITPGPDMMASAQFAKRSTSARAP